MFDFSLTQQEVLCFDKKCKSGHAAYMSRFFEVCSDLYPEINGVYCEDCLKIANRMARNIKKKIK